MVPVYSHVLEAPLALALFHSHVLLPFLFPLVFSEELGIHLFLHTLAFEDGGRFLNFLRLSSK